jgi:hypothetical protein
MGKTFRRQFQKEIKSFGRQFKREARKALRPPRRPKRSFFDMFMDEVTGAPR